MPKASTKKVLSLVAVLVVAIPAGAHAGFVRAGELKREAQLERMTAMLAPLAGAGANVNTGTRLVSLNGALVGFKTTTVPTPIDDVMKNVESDCRSGNIETALAGTVKNTPEDPSKNEIELAHIDSQSGADGQVRASLCTFSPDRNESSDTPHITTGGKGDLPRVRYTLAQRIDASTTRVITVVNASSTPLEAMFPAEGDAPGSDLRGVARPENAKRTLTALVDGNQHEVRMYETGMAISEAMTSYDRGMRSLGWATSSSLPEARMYSKDGESIIASFLAIENGTNVSIAPFEPISH